MDGPLLADASTQLASVARALPVVFPVHPRTRERIEPRARLAAAATLLEPLGYLDFLALEASAAAVLTDSGGVQEETTYLGVPCFTLRDNTERPVTVDARHERPARARARRDRRAAGSAGASAETRGIAELPGWDGRAGERVADILLRDLAPEPVAERPAVGRA